mmetsp:Transcript_23463/g.41680  ORF Transcript_23463/g.41680 Transcript_23463/m.41680 type:complete len:224 (-) Transcript_23463:751-1422(-)
MISKNGVRLRDYFSTLPACVPLYSLWFSGVLAHVQGLASDLGVEVQHVVHRAFKVSGGVIALRDEALVLLRFIDGDGVVAHQDKLLFHMPQKSKAWKQLCLGVVSLHCGAHKGNPFVLCHNIVTIRAAEDVDVMLPVQLLLGKNDLGGMGFICVLDRMIQNTHGADDLADLFGLSREIAGITNHKLTLCCLSVAFHTNGLASIVEHHLCVWLCEHVGTAVYCT